MAFSADGRRAAAAKATRARIVVTARRLFEDQGFDEVSVRDVVRASSVSTGAVYHCWRSMEELFAEAMGRPVITEARGAQLLAALEEENPARAAALRSQWSATA